MLRGSRRPETGRPRNSRSQPPFGDTDNRGRLWGLVNGVEGDGRRSMRWDSRHSLTDPPPTFNSRRAPFRIASALLDRSKFILQSR